MTTELLLPAREVPGADLPVRSALADVLLALQQRGTAVLVAPPGSGKTSLLPLALADEVPGQVLVAEPRRIATRAAARRMAELISERPGERVGYAMRGERAVSAATRVEVVTTGLLVQRMQRDPELAGVSAVVIDECHERHLDSDLALAFCLDVRANLREDLYLVATSATPDERIGALLGSDGESAPVISAAARAFAVDVVWAAPERPIPLLRDYRVDPRLLDHVANVVRRALVEAAGDVLVFVPGEAEIASLVRRLGHEVDVVQLYGRQSAADQDRALRPGNRRRVVVSTAVAESSLTVPGVRIVVDAGLSREPRIDHARGLSTLVTTKVSSSSADQRAGRAGREAPGVVYRCWSQSEHVHLVDHAAPEIQAADLTGFALAVAAWGQPRGTELGWLDQPPAPALDAAEATLQALGALDDRGRITLRGREIASVGTQPRLARAVIDGGALVGADRAREIVALLSDDALARQDDDLVAVLRRLRSGQDAGATARWRAEVRRLARTTARDDGRRGTVNDDVAAGLIVGLAFPERLARGRSAGGQHYLMAGGTGAQLDANSGLRGSAWIAVAVADRGSGRADARVRLAAPIDEAGAREVGSSLLRVREEIGWADGELVLRQRENLGSIVLVERPLLHPDPAKIIAAVEDGLRSVGLHALRWSKDAEQLRQRMSLCHKEIGTPWPDVGDVALLADLSTWLAPELAKVRRRTDFGRADAGLALRRLLPWPAAARLDELAPERVTVPSGSRVRLTYVPDGPPVLAVKLQEVFGWRGTPTVADGRVPVVLHLLSPAGRPVAITADLASFWQQGYPQVRAELRGRYPRHPWPADPTVAEPTRRLRPRS